MTKLKFGHVRVVSYMCVLAGIVYWVFYPELAAQNVFVDENAIQSDYAGIGLTKDWSKNFENFETQFRQIVTLSANDSQSFIPKIQNWISNVWSQMGIIHNYQYSNTDITNDSSIQYGVYKSAFSEGKMAVIVALSYETNDIHRLYQILKNGKSSQPNSAELKQMRTLSTVASFLTLAQYLTSVNWCSKDIIYILIQRDTSMPNGLQSSYALFDEFIHNYLYSDTTNDRYIHRQSSKNFVGGLTLDLPLYIDDLSSLGLRISGVMGFQPNMDILSTAIAVFNRANLGIDIAPSYNRDSLLYTPPLRNIDDTNAQRITAFRSMTNQAIGKPDGYHGYLTKHQIDAITIHSNEFSMNGSPNAIFQLFRGIDLWVRSMSNLIEILHHSTFNYILLSQKRFVTMVKYFPSHGLFMASLILPGLALYKMYPAEISMGIIQGVSLLISSVSFGLYSYIVFHLAVTVTIPNEYQLDGFVSLFIPIFAVLIGLLTLLWVWRYFQLTRYIHYISSLWIVFFYAIMSQYWYSLCINFGGGVFIMLTTVVMLFTIYIGDIDNLPSLEISDHLLLALQSKTAAAAAITIPKHSFTKMGRLMRCIFLIILPIIVIYGMLLLFDVDFYTLWYTMAADFRDNPILERHTAWFLFFLVLVPLYLICWLVCFVSPVKACVTDAKACVTDVKSCVTDVKSPLSSNLKQD